MVEMIKIPQDKKTQDMVQAIITGLEIADKIKDDILSNRLTENEIKGLLELGIIKRTTENAEI